MRIVFECENTNPRRYGRAWIAKVTAWPIGQPPTLEFGYTINNIKAEIEAEPGVLLKAGRKDHRGGATINAFYVVQERGGLKQVDAETARELWLARVGVGA